MPVSQLKNDQDFLDYQDVGIFFEKTAGHSIIPKSDEPQFRSQIFNDYTNGADF
jgi:hypothetical protein